MSGRLLEAVRIVPPALWRHLGGQFGVGAPYLASLRTMYDHVSSAVMARGSKAHYRGQSQRAKK